MDSWLEEAKEARANGQMPDHLVRDAGSILRHATDKIESSTDDSRCVASASHSLLVVWVLLAGHGYQLDK